MDKVASSIMAQAKESHVSSAKEPNFDSLPDLFLSEKELSIREKENEYSSFLPMTGNINFDSSIFWESASELGECSMRNFPDSFCPWEEFGMLDNVEDTRSNLMVGPDILGPGRSSKLSSPIDLQSSQYSVDGSSGTGPEDTTSRNHIREPLLEPENLEWTLHHSQVHLGQSDDGQAEVYGGDSVDKYLVSHSPRSCHTNGENSNSSLLVCPPRGYVDDICIFRSKRAAGRLDGDSLMTTPEKRVHDLGQTEEDRRRSNGAQFEDMMPAGDLVTSPGIPKSDMAIHLSEKIHDQAGLVRTSVRYCSKKRSVLPPGTKKLQKASPLSRERRVKRSHSGIHKIKSDCEVKSPTERVKAVTHLLPSKSSSCADSLVKKGNQSLHGKSGMLKMSLDLDLSMVAEDVPGKNTLHEADSYHDSTDPSQRRDFATEGRGRYETVKISDCSTSTCLLKRKRTRYVQIRDSTTDSKIKTGIHTHVRRPSLSEGFQISDHDIRANSPRDHDSLATETGNLRDRGPVRKFKASAESPAASVDTTCFHLEANNVDPDRSGDNFKLRRHLPVHLPAAEGPIKTSVARRPTRTKREPLPQRAVEVLRRWLSDNMPFPYPSREEKDDLVSRTGLKMSQIENWMGNARQKFKISKRKSRKARESDSSSSPEQPKKLSKTWSWYTSKTHMR